MPTIVTRGAARPLSYGPPPSFTRVGINRIPSARPWRYDGNGTNGWGQDGWFNQTPMSGSTIGKLNALADFSIKAYLAPPQHLTVRIEVPWRLIEQPAQGNYDWSHMDYVIGLCAQNGMIVHAVPMFTPAWIGAYNAVPPAAAFASFVTQLVKRYKSTVRYWEMWNEPNDGSNHYFTGTAAQYVSNVLNPGYAAVKAEDPNAIVICAGVAFNWASWIAGLTGANFDYMGFHDYPGGGSQVNTDYNTAMTQLATSFPSAPPLWIDEFGVQDAGTNIVAMLNAVYPTNAQTVPSGKISFYTTRDDNVCQLSSGSTTISPESTLRTGLTGGVAATTLDLTAGKEIGGNLASGDPLTLVSITAAGVVSFQNGITVSAAGYVAGASTIQVNSFVPNFWYPVGTQIQVLRKSPTGNETYGLMDRGGGAKGSAVSTFRSWVV